MDDETVYGKVSYKLAFAEAARREIICSYKILISVITTDELNAYLLDHGTTLVDGDQIGVRWVANQLALKRAVEQREVSKIITFHSRVRTAKSFVEASSRGIARHINDFSVFHVNGEQPAAVRDDTLDAFRNADKALIANARCLTEGVDVPAVDMVAFIDPRKSPVDIAQAAGRAMRKAPNTNKTVGYVVVPLFLEQAKGQSIEEALERSDFGEVADVVNAMREQDDLLIEIIRELRESRGRDEVFNPRRLRDSVEVIGPAISLNAIADAIDVQLIERLGSSWDEMFGRLVAYKQKYGDCLVPYSYSDKQLFTWVSSQRSVKNRGKLDSARFRRLEELGFVWDARDANWEEMFGKLVAYKQQFRDCFVPTNYSDKKLAAWVHTQRVLKTSGILETVRTQRLDDLGFSWDPIDEAWEEMFGRLVAYKQKHGHCLVPINYSDKKLAKWVNHERDFKKKGTLEGTRVQRLEELGFIWNPHGDSWEEMLGRLVAYKGEHGNCLVPKNNHKDNKLGTWVNFQRSLKKKGKLETSRIQRLDALDFVWEPISEAWEEMFGRLVAYKRKCGDCLVPINYSDKELARWVVKQRTLMIKNSGTLETKRIQRLAELGFLWDRAGERWEEMFGRLVAYKQKHGDCLVPQKYSDKQLSNWVRHQRDFKKKGTLETERVQRLTELGFSWVSRNLWEEMFGRLVAYKQTHGDCLVPQKYSDKQLSNWVSHQRAFKKKSTLETERVQRLTELGFSWEPFGETWEEMFGRLVAYKKNHGDCLVMQNYKDKQLVTWVNSQRGSKRRGKLESERIQRLEALDFAWNPISEYWERMFGRLVAYQQKHGDCRVPDKYDENKQLATWVGAQRGEKNNRTLEGERIQRLNALGFIWNPHGDSWEEMFNRLFAYQKQHGDCLVPGSYSDKQLARWAVKQRTLKNRGKLDPARVQRLKELGFVWKVRE